MLEWVDKTDLKSVAYGVPVRVRVRAPNITLLWRNWLAQSAHNALVVGSSPTGSTN